MTYLDNSATTKLAPEVVEAMLPYLREEYGNASSVYGIGSAARVAVEESRERIAHLLGGHPRELIFTSGGTEANNSAIKGTYFQLLVSGKNFAAVTSMCEHHSVLEPSEFLRSLGCDVRFARCLSSGHIDRAHLEALLTPEVRFVSVMHVNNEIGAINPITEIASMLRQHDAHIVFHVDAVQSFGKFAIDTKTLGADLLTISSHKIHGPKGIGALWSRSGIEWIPLLHGGAQERNRRGGTESVANIVGFAEAAELAHRDLERINAHFSLLKEHLVAQLSTIQGVVFNSEMDAESSAPWIASITFKPELLQRLDAEALLILFDLEGVAVSNGSACTSGTMQPSHVLLAMGKGEEVARKSIRVSFSRYTTHQDIDAFVAALQKILANAT